MHSSHYNNQNFNNMMEQTKNLNPYMEEAHQSNNNNNNSALMNSMTMHNGLRAASHVSMDNTPNAHEYQPTCRCADCQALLSHYTKFDLVDAFVGQHLQFEAKVAAQYGFVPCQGGPHGAVAMDISAKNNNSQQQQPITSNMIVFHMHLHEMNAVSAEQRERNYARFFANPSSTNNNNNQQQQHVEMPAPRNNNNNYYNNNNRQNNNFVVPAPHSQQQQQQSFATHQNVYQGKQHQYRYNNNNNNQQQNNYYNNAQQYYYNNNNNNYQQQQYSASDIEHVKNSVAFSGVARLGN